MAQEWSWDPEAISPVLENSALLLWGVLLSSPCLNLSQLRDNLGYPHVGSGVLARWGDCHLIIWLRAYAAASRTEQQGAGKFTKCKVWGNLLRGSGKCSEEERLK